MSRLILCLVTLVYSIIYTVKPTFFLSRIQKRYPKLDDGTGVEKEVFEVNEATIKKARKYGIVVILFATFATLKCLYQMFWAA